MVCQLDRFTFGFVELGGAEHVPVGLEELISRHSLAALWSGFDSAPLHDIGDRGPANPMADVFERVLDRGVTPA